MGYKQQAKIWARNNKDHYVCQCGCGNKIKIKWYHFYKEMPKYISGHNMILDGKSSSEWVKENQGKHLCQCGCKKPIKINRHYKSKGIPKYTRGHQNRGENNGKWKGGKVINVQGYRLIKKFDHPNSHDGYVLEHRLLAENVLGRFLTKHEVVHHINKNILDNRLKNLTILSKGDHGRIHAGKDISFRTLAEIRLNNK